MVNVLVRKISLNRLENLQKLPVYGKSPHQRQLRGEACILHYGMSRQKQIPNLSTLANLPVFKKGELASKKKKKKKKLLLCKHFIKISKWLYIRKSYETWKKKATNNKNKAFEVLLTDLSKAFVCLSDLLIPNFHANSLTLLFHVYL